MPAASHSRRSATKLLGEDKALCQLHSSLNGGSGGQGGMDGLTLPAPPLGADTPLDTDPLLDLDTLLDP